MPFARPSLDELRQQAAADLAAALPGADPLLPVSNLGVIADVQAEGFSAEYGYLDYIAKQAVPFTAVDEAFLGWAALKKQTQKPPTKAAGTGTWSGTIGIPLLDGTPVSRGDGQAYVTVGDAAVGIGGTVTANLLAVEPGAAGTLVTGSALLLGVAIAGITASGTATAGTPGVDLEDFETFRTRVLAVYANPPQGGASSDYIEWAEQVAGVTRAWCVPHGHGAGTVVVYAMMDVAEIANGGFPQGVGGCAAAENRDTPATLDLLTIADWIYPLQPVTALVYVFAPQANTVAFTISLPGASADLKVQVEAAIDSAFLAFGVPGGAVMLSDVLGAILALSGTRGLVVTAESCSHGSIAPGVGNIISNAGYLPVRGAVTWS